jgi:hypothetical protein
MVLQVASGAIILIIPMPVCLMATMAQTGSMTACLSARGRGFKVGMAIHGDGAMVASAITAGADGMTTMDGVITMAGAIEADGVIAAEMAGGEEMAATMATDMPAGATNRARYEAAIMA